MSMYTHFAQVYDLFMDNVDYEAWSKELIALLKKDGIADGLICELGCGTGAMTTRLADAGYDMIGIDVSEEMLGIAQRNELLRRHPELRAENDGDPEKAEASPTRPDILYLLQDMRAFELYGTVRAVVSVCDSLNYITEEEDLLQVFRLVNNYLDPGGLFLFDMTTAARYAAIGDSTIAEDRPGGSFIWENTYDAEQKLNRYDLTLFLPVPGEEETSAQRVQVEWDNAGAAAEDFPQAEESGCLYRRYNETHFERAYDLRTIRRLLEEAGLQFVSATEAYTDAPVTEQTERMLVLARERGKAK